MQMHGSSGPSTMPTAPIGMAMNFSQQQAMLAQQNSNMEALERRREHERAAMAQRSDPAARVSTSLRVTLDLTDLLPMNQRPVPPRGADDDDSGGKSLQSSLFGPVH